MKIMTSHPEFITPLLILPKLTHFLLTPPLNLTPLFLHFEINMKSYQVSKRVSLVKTFFWVKSSEVNDHLTQRVVTGDSVLINNMENQVPE